MIEMSLYPWVEEFRWDSSQSSPGQGLMKERDREVEQLRATPCSSKAGLKLA